MEQIRLKIEEGLPAWVEPYTRKWIERFRLYRWRIEICKRRVVDDDPNLAGSVTYSYDLSHAVITVCTELEESEYWKGVIVHELLHIYLAGLDDIVERTILPRFEGHAAAAMKQVYKRELEMFINLLDDLLVDLESTIKEQGDGGTQSQ